MAFVTCSGILEIYRSVLCVCFKCEIFISIICRLEILPDIFIKSIICSLRICSILQICNKVIKLLCRINGESNCILDIVFENAKRGEIPFYSSVRSKNGCRRSGVIS